MADYELNSSNGNISYPGFTTGDLADKRALMLKGGTGKDGEKYPKVDMSLWDQSTMCATCHVGGAFYEHDRQGRRLPVRAMMDMGMQDVNPITSTVWEQYNAATGADESFVTSTPWIYPQYIGNNPANGPMGLAQGVQYGWGQAMIMKDPNTGADMPVSNGQLMMPNVKEMDCLFCHLQGYDNVMTSVMVQAGSLNAAPAAGAGLFDMTPGSPTYMGYNPGNGNVQFADVTGMPTMQMVSFTDAFVSKIKAKPDTNNCMQCHATKTLKNMPEMFGVTGTSSGFLSSAPMIYDPANGVGPLGKRMTAYDINAMWLQSGSSPVINFGNYSDFGMPGMSYLQAMGPTPFAAPPGPGFLGGGNAAGTGPLYYYNDTQNPDQNALKKSVAVFARAEWFKRGDAWQDGQDVHSSFGCGGCHYTGDTTHKNQCDPGRGFDMMSGMQDGVPPLKNRGLVTNADGSVETPDKHDTRNTAKRCEFCHVTGKDYYGNPIQTFGAPNPDAKHQAYKLAGTGAVEVQIVDKFDLHGTFGGQGVSDNTDFTHDKTKLGRGNHLDVMDCTVCHVQKKSMVVRTLDATTGMRYPVVMGTDPAQGMMGLFEDPAPAAFNEGARQKYNGMYDYINQYFGYTGGEAPGAAPAATSQACTDAKGAYGDTFDCSNMPGPGYQNAIPAGTHVVGGPLQEWKPLRVWQKLGNLELPLTTNLGTGANFSNSGASQMNFRRKIYLANPIVAAIWNNTDPAVDANGDGAPGGRLNNSKPSLAGYTDIFTGESLHKNNAQGFDEPIFDPWVMHDLKAGFNYGPSALSVIAVGFGGFGTPTGVTDPTGGAFQSAFMPDGTFTGAFKYVSVWSGAVMLTEPNEIRSYKNYRDAVEAAKPVADRKPWTGTELAYVGDPFMVTHGVKSPGVHVLGKSCADCHAPGAEFFNGGFTMTGLAIPADRTYNPTARLTEASVQGSNGDYIRNPGIPGLQSASNFLERPLEPFRVKAYNGDLRTSFEGFNKLGQPRTTEFQESDSTYTWTTDMKRSNVLYPVEKNDAGQEIGIYYKISDVDADGTPKAGAVALTGQQYADYMETLAADAPAPAIIANNITGGDGSAANPYLVMKGNTVALTAANGMKSYTWSAGGTTFATTQSAVRSFATVGDDFVITLTTVNAANNTGTSTAHFRVFDPATLKPVVAVSSDSSMTTDLVVSNIPPNAKKIKVDFGDGSSAFVNVAASPETVTHVQHAFRRNAANHVGTAYKYSVVVRAYNSRYAVISKSDATEISLDERTDYGVTTAFSLRYKKTPATVLNAPGNPTHLRDYGNYEFYYTAPEQRAFNYSIKVRNYGDSTTDTTVTVPDLGGLTGGKVSVIMPAGVTVTGIKADGLYHAGDQYTIHNLQKNKIGTITIRVTAPDTGTYTPADVTLTSDDNTANDSTAIDTSNPKVLVQRPVVKIN